MPINPYIREALRLAVRVTASDVVYANRVRVDTPYAPVVIEAGYLAGFGFAFGLGVGSSAAVARISATISA